MTRDQLRARASSGPEQLWWTYRFMQEVAESAATAAAEELEQAVDHFVRLAIADPSWAMKSLDDQGPGGHRLGQLLSADRVQRALEAIRLQSSRDDTLLRGRMLVASVRWASGRGETQSQTTWQEAWNELLRVPEPERDDEWNMLALGPSAYVAYGCYRELAEAHIARLVGFDRSIFLPKAVAVASRQKDWRTFEGWVKTYVQAAPGSAPTRPLHGCSGQPGRVVLAPLQN